MLNLLKLNLCSCFQDLKSQVFTTTGLLILVSILALTMNIVCYNFVPDVFILYQKFLLFNMLPGHWRYFSFPPSLCLDRD